MAKSYSKFNPSWTRTKGIKGPAFQQNKAYAERLNDYIRGIPKTVLGVYAATAIHNAAKATWKDSNRAAANWNLLFGSETAPPTAWDPAVYGQYPVADRGTFGALDFKVYEAKAAQYGYKEDGGFMVPQPGGAIYEKLKIGRAGTTRVVLYNPIFTPDFAAYRERAFMKGMDISSSIRQGQNFFGIDDINKNFIPKLIRELAQEVRWGHAYGKF